MMKKFLTALLVAALAVILVACGSNDKKESGGSEDGGKKTLTVGASNTPHAIILEEAAPILEEQGIELKIEEYTEFILPNKDLESGDLDANFFQHIPYLEGQIEDHGYDFVNAGSIHIEPIGVYSKKYKSLDELPENATILISNSVADHGRILAMLEDKGLITLADDIDKTNAEVKDIVENPKNIEFDANYEPALMTQLYNNDEGDAVLINSNFAIDAGINPLEDSIAIEDSESPYVNIVAVQKGDENNAEIKELIEALKSEKVQEFILEEWGGAVVPVE